MKHGLCCRNTLDEMLVTKRKASDFQNGFSCVNAKQQNVQIEMRLWQLREKCLKKRSNMPSLSSHVDTSLEKRFDVFKVQGFRTVIRDN